MPVQRPTRLRDSESTQGSAEQHGPTPQVPRPTTPTTSLRRRALSRCGSVFRPLARLTRRLLFCYIHLLNHWFNSRLLVHPVVEEAFAEAPAVAEFEGGDEAFGGVAVERVAADPQVLRRLADIHDLTQYGLCLCRCHRLTPILSVRNLCDRAYVRFRETRSNALRRFSCAL